MSRQEVGQVTAGKQGISLRIASIIGEQQIDESRDEGLSGALTPEKKDSLRAEGAKTPTSRDEQASGGNCTPLTPLANLKVLIAAASSAFVEEGNVGDNSAREDLSIVDEEINDKSSGRKMKSLAMLCKKFLTIVEGIGTGKEFSLDTMAQSLAINRRRIYDIINVLEALEMISKQSKNWYIWLGRNNLVATLAKLKAMAVDDPDFQPLIENKENEGPSIGSDSINCSDSCKSSAESEDDSYCGEQGDSFLAPRDDASLYEQDPNNARSIRQDKSLGVLCQKFVMLFLISPNNEITLDDAGSLLVPDGSDDVANPFAAISSSSNPKTKVRRLYDIANILMSLGLIRKKTFIGPAHTKRPGYSWCGASMKEIEAIPVHRKNEQPTSKLKGTALSRRASYGPGSGRPFLHQYEVKGVQQPYSSAPCVSSDKKGFKRSLSFGATPNPNRPPCVIARPCPRQLEYMNEVKEFEAEVQKNSSRYPHVAPIFHEFIHRYKSTLEQAASAGRMILPKPTDTSVVENLVTNLLTNNPLQSQQKCSGTQTAPLPFTMSTTTTSPEHVTTTPPHNNRGSSPTCSAPVPLHSPKQGTLQTPTTSTVGSQFVSVEDLLMTSSLSVGAEERTHPIEALTPKGSSLSNLTPLSRSTPNRSSPTSVLSFQTTLPFTKSGGGGNSVQVDDTSPPKKQKLEFLIQI